MSAAVLIKLALARDSGHVLTRGAGLYVSGLVTAATVLEGLGNRLENAPSGGEDR